MADNKKLWDPWKLYDVSAEELRAVRERAKMRQELKAKWTKQFTNPWKGAHGGYLFDPAVQKFISLKATQYEYFKGTHKSMLIAFALFFVPAIYLTYDTTKIKKELEGRLRNGEVKYKDRREKFYY
ncbi:unnamed protein product [Candidula unifasciata]|uniref:NADH dehydrogenase [ubiquinone] 1 beta subcomplex subunit 4 n=1 Tax=Candidula unifasciata TaxID=100452 RepID=A0A8S3ZXF5_9EUPU|nr:unnamed protein product [Candidula unifasciata]